MQQFLQGTLYKLFESSLQAEALEDKINKTPHQGILSTGDLPVGFLLSPRPFRLPPPLLPLFLLPLFLLFFPFFQSFFCLFFVFLKTGFL